MALYYSEFVSSPANLLADINTQIANCTDWARPNSGSRANTWKATTTRGADMVVDFAGAAINTDYITIGSYYSYDGTTLGAASPLRYIRWGQAGGATSKTLRCVLSVSKEHLYLEIEGPRAGETLTDNTTYGSQRRSFYIGDMVPYFATGTDPNPAVIVAGQPGSNINAPSDAYWYKVLVSKTIGGLYWQPGILATLAQVANPNQGAHGDSLQRQTIDGNYYLAPYVYFDDVDGLRGRLNNIYFAGWTEPSNDWNIPSIAPGSTIVYSSVNYRIRAAYRSASNWISCGPFGYAPNNAGAPNVFFSPLVAVPKP